MNDDARRIQVYLLDDQVMIRAALRALLGETPRFEVVGESGNARDAVAEIERLRPDVVLTDIAMPGLSGLDAIPMIRKVAPRTRILMLSQQNSESFVEQALQLGAEGYLSKDSDPSELRIAIEAVHRGDPFVSPRVASGLVSMARGDAKHTGGPVAHTRLEGLTPREREVFQLLAVGKSNKEVARELDSSLGTAKKHRENLQRKLACQSPADLTRLAIREGLLDIG